MVLNERNYLNLSQVDKKDYKKYIGNGYRYCSYVTHTEQIKGKFITVNGKRRVATKQYGYIYLRGFDPNGNPQNFLIPHSSHIKYIVKYPTKEKDMYGRFVETRYFESTKEREEYIKSSGIKDSIIEKYRPEYEFLHEMFDDCALDENFNLQKLRIFFYDIETEIGDDGFERGITARQRINMITIYDTLTEKYYTWSLSKIHKDFSDEYDDNGNLINECPLKDINPDDFIIFEFSNNEKRMLNHFLDWFQSNYPDVFVGFNSQSFDDSYLINRIERVLGDPSNVSDGDDDDNSDENIEFTKVVRKFSSVTKRLSPVGRINVRVNNTENERSNKSATELYSIGGIFLADELILYRDKFKIHQPLDGGCGLDNIGEVEVGIHKVHYKGTKAPNGDIIHSLKDLYLKDWNRFYKYNVMDVHVLRKVEERVKTIAIARLITSSGLTNYDEIYASIGYLIGSISMFSKTQMNIVFTSYKAKEKTAIPYEGAYVFPPTPGLYDEGVMCVDFNSLYPNSMIASNVSPETYVGKISRFPIEDPTSMFFAKEPPIDLFNMDTTKVLPRTKDESEYNDAYGTRLYNGKLDCEIEKFYFLPANGSKQRVITRTELLKLIDTKCIFTRNNTLFLKHSIKQGVVSAWCEHFYKIRKTIKNKGQKLDLDLHNGLIIDNIDFVKEQIDTYDNIQQARKISLNSVYGCCSTKFSPIYNPYIAQTITRTGKFCNQSSAEYIKKCFKERFGIDETYVNTTSGDTDTFVQTSKIRIKR